MFCTKSLIKKKIDAYEGLEHTYLLVQNESNKHNVPKDAQTHFKVVVVAAGFQGLLPVARHRLIYQILGGEIMANIHALSIHCYTPDEWVTNKAKWPKSPLCRGGESKTG